MLPYQEHTPIHPIAMTLLQVVVNMLAVVLEIKKKNLLAGVPGVALPGAHTIQPIAIKLSQVVNMFAMDLEK